jgi:hypothetical protein
MRFDDSGRAGHDENYAFDKSNRNNKTIKLGKTKEKKTTATKKT